jgi:L-aspartate oxidase
MISQRGQRTEFDVIVIGSGIAGLTSCLELSKQRPKTRIALISKESLSESNSYYAQGGIAAATTAQDSVAQHVQDTHAAGDGLGDAQVIHTIISSGPEYIKHLSDQGVRFDQSMAWEGGHSQRRIFHHADQTGREIIEKLTQRVQERRNITLFEFHVAVNLVTRRNHRGNGVEVVGTYILDCQSGLIHTMLAKIVILATGGAGKTYRYTTNPDVATGDGIAMAYRAAARVSHMEFYQFHPTLFYHPQLRNFLISEAVRGEGAVLRLVNNGERFMQRYCPEQMELATRDKIARAIFTEIEQNAYNFVYLDITHHSEAFLEKRFPKIFHTLLDLNINMSKDMIPVVPAAHYLCGGVVADIYGKTSTQRLYAIGEVACTGFHGANRLASNSLLEASAMAHFCVKDCIQYLDEEFNVHHDIRDWDSQSVTDPRRASQINAHWRSLRGEMMSYAGIVRTEAGLKDLLQIILTRKHMIEEYYWKHVITRDLIELRNIIFVAELIVRSALKRRNSYGCHFREDFPLK